MNQHSSSLKMSFNHHKLKCIAKIWMQKSKIAVRVCFVWIFKLCIVSGVVVSYRAIVSLETSSRSQTGSEILYLLCTLFLMQYGRFFRTDTSVDYLLAVIVVLSVKKKRLPVPLQNWFGMLPFIWIVWVLFSVFFAFKYYRELYITWERTN